MHKMQNERKLYVQKNINRTRKMKNRGLSQAPRRPRPMTTPPNEPVEELEVCRFHTGPDRSFGLFGMVLDF